MPLHLPKMGILAPNFAFLDKHCQTRGRFSDNVSTTQNLNKEGCSSVFCCHEAIFSSDQDLQLSMIAITSHCLLCRFQTDEAKPQQSSGAGRWQSTDRNQSEKVERKKEEKKKTKKEKTKT